MADLEFTRVAAYIAAGACMGIGTLGPALGLGFIGGKACESVGKKPESAAPINRTMITAMAFVEATAVYALAVAFFLLAK